MSLSGMSLSRVEAQLIFSKSLGNVVEIEEIPTEKADFLTLLVAGTIFGVGAAAFIGFPLFTIINGIQSTRAIAPFTKSVENFMAFFGALGFLGTYGWYYWYSIQPYASRTIILTHGFIYDHILAPKKHRHKAARYDDITVMRLFFPSLTKIIYKYYVKNQEECFLFSESLVLMRHVGSYIVAMRWAEVKNLIKQNDEACFGNICLSKSYVKIKGYSDQFEVSSIKGIQLCLSGDGDEFHLIFYPNFRSKWPSGAFVPCSGLDNPHLFYKALKLIGIPLNLEQCPKLEDHFKLFEDVI